MIKPDFITFTGIDTETNLTRVLSLSKRYPVEWAVLFSSNRQGLEARYPSLDYIAAFRHFPVRKALHLCGMDAKLIVKGIEPTISPDGFARVQVNHREPHSDNIEAILDPWGAIGIVQVRELEWPEFYGVDMLFDRSGGTGTVPSEWPRHLGGDNFVGYAGGIRPDNVLDVLQAIEPTGPYWIDMESGVRTDDWLDLDKCEAVLKAVYS